MRPEAGGWRHGDAHESAEGFGLRGQGVVGAGERGGDGVIRERDETFVGRGRGVEERKGVFGGLEQLGGRGGGEGLGGLGDGFDAGAAFFVDAVDRGAGDDVVELAHQQVAPEAEHFLGGIGGTRLRGGGGAEHFGGTHGFLGAAVAEFLARLRCVGAAVEFEVELADPGVETETLFGNAGHRLLGKAEGDARATVEGGAAQTALDVLLLGTAAAIADAAEGDSFVDDAGFAVVGFVAVELFREEERVVGVLRREVGEDLRAVDAFPDEGVVREFVVAVPGELLGQEEVEPADAQNLRKLAGVAEDIREPERARHDAEFVAEEVHAVEELADEGFAVGQVAVGFHPHAALDFPFALGDGVAHLFEEGGIVLFAVAVELRLGGAEAVARVALDETQL